MTDTSARRMVRNLVALGAGNYAAMAVSLGINALLTRRLGVEAFGQLALLLMCSQVLSMAVANWTQTGLVRFGAQEFAETGSASAALWTRVWLVAPWALVVSALAFVAREPLARYLSVPAAGLLVVLAHFIASFALTTVGSVCQAAQAMSRYGALLFLDKAVMATLLLLLPAIWMGAPLRVLGLYAASSLAVAAGGATVLGRRSVLPVAFSAERYRRMLAFSLPLAFSSWAGVLGTNWFDLIVIRWYRPVAEVGLYALGTVLAGVVQQVAIVFSTLLLPELSVMVARGEDGQIKRLVERGLPYWALATSALFSAVVVGAAWIVPLIFGPAFARSAAVLALLMPASCALVLFSALSPLVAARGSTWALTSICVASGLTNVVMDLALVPRYGIIGAALATVIAYTTSAVLVLVFVRRRLNIDVYGLGLLALPVAAVSTCFVVADGILFYGLAMPAGAVTLIWLARRFRLFQGAANTPGADVTLAPGVRSR
jgi:O-antigen/teichoic acid export membrane protein